jgi:hypothetical protein
MTLDLFVLWQKFFDGANSVSLFCTYLIENVLVTVDGALRLPNLQHCLVPILKPLIVWYFLLRWMAVENVVNAFARWICPNMGLCIAKLFGIL